MKNKLHQNPHRRFNPLTEEWVLVSPHRLKRPWQGKVESLPIQKRPEYDPNCYLCPGNKRAGGKKNPKYSSTFVFDNDFSALLPKRKTKINSKINSLLLAQPESGICRVICFSPKHNLTLPQMKEKDIRKVIDLWIKQYRELGKKDFIKAIQIFENKGEIMGCSNPHPHGQIWATESIPVEPAKENKSQKAYFEKNHKCLLCDYLNIEKKQKIRIVCENSSWIVVIPFWAIWPYETLVLPKRHVGDLTQLKVGEKKDLANILKRITIRYDNLFNISFPYTMGFHQSPTNNQDYSYWHLHIHFYPPLLRSATVKKFMVGFEMMGMPQRDITAELAAEKLRSLPEKLNS